MIHIISALHCESRPLIGHYRLRRRKADDIFPVYVDRSGNLSLTVSGTGKVSASAATMYTSDIFGRERSDAWLNIGIAAHERMAIGEAAMARCICDPANGRNWYPQFVFDPPCRLATLLTLDMPSTSYLDKLYDLEGSGFYETACRVSTAELIHVLKVISDNRDHPAKRFSEHFVEELIRAQLETIDYLVDFLRDLSLDPACVVAEPGYYAECLERWRMTQYQKNRLYRLLQRWKLLCPEINPLEEFSNISETGSLLKSMHEYLDEQTVDSAGTGS